MVGDFSCLEKSGLFLFPFLRNEVLTEANRIMGITVEIGGDTTKRQTAFSFIQMQRRKIKNYIS